MADYGRVRQRVLFSGHVQGVGFRYTTAQLAKSQPITGFVKNLANGQVLLVVEGSESAVHRFVRTVQQAMQDYLTDTHTTDEAATGEFATFSIA